MSDNNYYAAPQADLDCPTLSLLAARRTRAVAIMFRVIGWPMTILYGVCACTNAFLIVWSSMTERKTDWGFAMGIGVAFFAAAISFRFVQIAKLLEKGDPAAKQSGIMYSTLLLVTGLFTPLGVFCLRFISKYYDVYSASTNPGLVNRKVDARPTVQTVIRLFRWIGWPFLFISGLIALSAFVVSFDVRNAAHTGATIGAIISVALFVYFVALLVAAELLKRGRCGAKWFCVALSALLLPSVAFTIAGVYCIVALLNSYDDYCDQLVSENAALPKLSEDRSFFDDSSDFQGDVSADLFVSEDALPPPNPQALPFVSAALFLGGAIGVVACILSVSLLIQMPTLDLEAFPAPTDRAAPFILAIAGLFASIGTVFAASRMHCRDMRAKPLAVICLFVGILIGVVLTWACGPLGLFALVPSVAGLGAVRIVYTDTYCNLQDDDDVIAADIVEPENGP